MTLVLDTHIWIWWVSDAGKISDAAHEAIRQAMESSSLFISSISAWEAAMLHKRGRLELTAEIGDWIALSEALPFVRFVPVSNQIAIKAVTLAEPFHSDPADRIIVATALSLGASIVTMDRRILDYSHVRSLC